MNNYRLVDYYEGRQIIAKADNWEDIKKERKQFIEDTDGECDLEVEQFTEGHWEVC